MDGGKLGGGKIGGGGKFGGATLESGTFDCGATLEGTSGFSSSKVMKTSSKPSYSSLFFCEESLFSDASV